jgi:membrane-bound metal-dependent hydrolase YbcI (DUF457 family)
MGKTHMAFGGLFGAVGVPLANHALGLELSTSEQLSGVAIATVAGLLPDIDHPNSLLTMGVIPGSRRLRHVGRVAGFLLSIPPRIVGAAVRQVMNHRGGTHSLLFAFGWAFLAAPAYAVLAIGVGYALGLLAGAAVQLLPVGGAAFLAEIDASAATVAAFIGDRYALIAVAVFLGYLSHLVSDSMTNVPIPWPWPLRIGPNDGRWFLLPQPLRITTGSFVETRMLRPLVTLLAVGASALLIGLPAVQHLLEDGRGEQTGATLQAESRR